MLSTRCERAIVSPSGLLARFFEFRPDGLFECSAVGLLAARLQLTDWEFKIGNDAVALDLEQGESILAVVLSDLIDDCQRLVGGQNSGLIKATAQGERTSD